MDRNDTVKISFSLSRAERDGNTTKKVCEIKPSHLKQAGLKPAPTQGAERNLAGSKV